MDRYEESRRPIVLFHYKCLHNQIKLNKKEPFSDSDEDLSDSDAMSEDDEKPDEQPPKKQKIPLVRIISGMKLMIV